MTPMRDDDDLKPGVDKPTRAQYVIGAVVIVDVNRRISEAIDPKSCIRTWNRSTAASTFASGLGEKPPVEW